MPQDPSQEANREAIARAPAPDSGRPDDPSDKDFVLPAALWRPSDANLQHLFSCAAGSVAGLGLLALTFASLPHTLFLIPFAGALFGWVWMSARALRANRELADLVEHGLVAFGWVDAIASEGDSAYELDATFRAVTAPADDGSARDGVEERRLRAGRLTRFTVRRYHEGMRIAVLYDPEAPERAALYPPPGGGTAGDLLGDCVAWLMGGEADEQPPGENTSAG